MVGSVLTFPKCWGVWDSTGEQQRSGGLMYVSAEGRTGYEPNQKWVLGLCPSCYPASSPTSRKSCVCRRKGLGTNLSLLDWNSWVRQAWHLLESLREEAADSKTGLILAVGLFACLPAFPGPIEVFSSSSPKEWSRDQQAVASVLEHPAVVRPLGKGETSRDSCGWKKLQCNLCLSGQAKQRQRDVLPWDLNMGAGEETFSIKVWILEKGIIGETSK